MKKRDGQGHGFTETSQVWVEAAKKLDKNSSEKVLCPECGDAHLDVSDIEGDKEDDPLVRILSCQNCGAGKEMLMWEHPS